MNEIINAVLYCVGYAAVLCIFALCILAGIDKVESFIVSWIKLAPILYDYYRNREEFLEWKRERRSKEADRRAGGGIGW